ncbi:MAG: DHA2 family efflux MFS transporter permease subunit [Hyphomicrobiales bacterium]
MSSAAAPVDIPAPATRHARWPLVVAVVLAAILEVLDTTIVNVAIPHMLGSFGATMDQITWVLTSYIVSAAVVMPLTGYLSTRFGRRNVLITAIVGFAISSMLCGISWSLVSMVAFRLAQGCFGAVLVPLSQTILFTAFPREKRGQAMALFGLGIIVAPVLGPTIGAILTETFSWRAVFYVNVPVAVLALMLALGEIPSEPPRPIRTDWIGLGLLALSIGALQFTIDQGESRDWFASRVIQTAAFLSASTGLAFIWWAWSKRDAIVDLTLFKDRNFLAANLSMLAFGVSMFGSIALIPLLVQRLLDYPVLDSGLLFMPRGLAAGVSMVLVGAVLLRRVDPRILVAIGLSLTAAGNLTLGFIDLDVDFWRLTWPGIIAGFGMGFFFVPLSTVAFDRIPREKADEAAGLYGVMRSIGSSIGIAFVGWQLVSRTQLHWNGLVGHITPYSEEAAAWLAPLGLSPSDPEGARLIAREIGRQAQMFAFVELFWVLGWTAVAMFPMILIMRRPSHAPDAPAGH